MKLPETPEAQAEVNEDQREKLLGIAEKLEAPELGLAARLELATVIRVLLGGRTAAVPVDSPGGSSAQLPPRGF